MPDIIWSDVSLADLRSIEAFLEPRDVAAAIRILRSIRSAAALLERFPAVGTPLEDDLRHLRIRRSPYLLVYRLAGPRVEMVRVRHVREDWLQRQDPE